MRIVGADKIQEGDVLGKSLFNERGELLLASGYKLNEKLIKLIKTQGYRFVYVMDEATKDINPEEVINDTVRQTVNQKLAEQFQDVQNNLAFEAFAPEEVKKRLESDEKVRGLLKMPSLRKQVGTILDEVLENNVTVFSSMPMKSDSGQSWQHSMDTTILSILIGQFFRMDVRELKLLGTASLVHDVGKMSFPTLVDKPTSELSNDEKMILREHPVYSMMILRGSDENSFVEQTTVMQHHENFNGTGYPQGLKGSGLPPSQTKPASQSGKFIHRYAEILAAANAYDNMISGMHDGVKHNPVEALAFMINGAGKEYNTHIVNAMTQIIQVFPVGSTIKIVDTASKQLIGYQGVIMKVNPADQSKPTVIVTHNTLGAPIKARVVDLFDERYVKLELVL